MFKWLRLCGGDGESEIQQASLQLPLQRRCFLDIAICIKKLTDCSRNDSEHGALSNIFHYLNEISQTFNPDFMDRKFGMSLFHESHMFHIENKTCSW